MLTLAQEKDDDMENWDQEKLEKVVATKHNVEKERTKSKIVQKLIAKILRFANTLSMLLNIKNMVGFGNVQTVAINVNINIVSHQVLF
jgi:hypothetical protein